MDGIKKKAVDPKAAAKPAPAAKPLERNVAAKPPATKPPSRPGAAPKGLQPLPKSAFARAPAERVALSRVSDRPLADLPANLLLRRGVNGLVSSSSQLLPTGASHAAAPPSLTPAQAAKKVEEAYEKDGPKAATEELKAQTEGKTPEEAAAIVQASQPVIVKVVEEFGGFSDNDFVDADQFGSAGIRAPLDAVLADLAVVTSRVKGAPNETQVVNGLADAVISAIGKKIGAFDEALGQTVYNGFPEDLAIAVADRLYAAGRTELAADIVQNLEASVARLGEDLDEAQATYDEHAARLESDLIVAAPAFENEAQREAYIEAFWARPEHAEAKAQLDEQALRLKNAITDVGPKLEAAAKGGSGDAAKTLLSTWERLGKTEAYADEAVKWVGHLNGDEALVSALAKEVDGDFEDHLSNAILAEAIPRAQGELIARYVDDPAGGSKKLAEDMAVLMSGFSTGKALKKIPGAIADLKKGLQDIANGVNDPKSTYATAKDILRGFDEKSKFGKALKTAVAAAGIFSAIKDFKGDATPENLNGLLVATNGGLEVTAGILKTFGQAKTALKVADLAGKFARVLNVTTDVLQLKKDIENLTKDGADAGEIIALLGTGVSLVGDVVSFIPGVGTVVGGAIGIFGSAIHAIGGLVSAIIHQGDAEEALEKERRELLEKAGVKGEYADIVLSDPEVSGQLSLLGLPREAVLEQVKAWKDADNQEETELQTVWNLAAMFGLQGEQALKFIQDFKKPEYADALLMALGSATIHIEARNETSAEKFVEGIEYAQDYIVEVMEAQGIPKALIEKYKLGDADFTTFNELYFVFEAEPV